MTDAVRSPRWLTQAWLVLLTAPASWAAALGLMFSLTDESWRARSLAAMASIGLVCTVLTVLPAPLAWWMRARIEPIDQSTGRARFMLAVAAGASLIFALVTAMSSVSMLLLDPCRT
jgi:hypothetical protein